MKPYEYTDQFEMWQYGQDYFGHPNWVIEGGCMEVSEEWDYDEPPFLEPAPVERIIVRPIMKCWGRGLKR